jgi:demethylmenaquinone methyltransferase / 2-methoxy-6-polyprenyl-1,4-benzoquinol methylase
VAQLIADAPWDEFLDAASGTGDIVLRVVERRPAAQLDRVIASDISRPMLAIAKQRLARVSHPVDLRILDAQRTPQIATNSVDLYSISLGLKICAGRRYSERQCGCCDRAARW